MTDASTLNELISRALRDLPAGLYFACEYSTQTDAAAVRNAGRVAARRALKASGFTGVAELPTTESGAPQWPLGWLGSISHSKGFCVAVVAREAEYRCLGVDLEHLGRMRPNTASRIATPAELAGISDSDHMTHATALFSLKEAFYKAQYPRYHVSPRFCDLELAWTHSTADVTINATSGVVKEELQDFCQRAKLLAWKDTKRVLTICYTR